MAYEVNSGCPVTPDGWVDLAAWTGRTLFHLPPAVRELDEALTHCESIIAVAGAACDPRSGGVAGTAHMAAFVGMATYHFRRHLLPRMDFVRDLGGIPVSNVASLGAWAEGYRAGVRRRKIERLGIDVRGDEL